MKAVTWQGRKDMRVEEVPDPRIEESTDVIIKVTSTGLCGSDLHLYDPLTPFMTPGDVVGHEPMGIVQEVGAGIRDIQVGDRVVIPFNVSCGECWMCSQHLYSQCETTQNREHGTGASFFGYSKLYGQVPGGQAEYLRVPFADFMCQKVPEGPADDRFLFLSDVLPTAWQGLQYADVPKDGSLVVLGAGPIGDMATRMALHEGRQVITVDHVPERLERVAARGAQVVNLDDGDVGDQVRELTRGRGADAVIDAVGMEAHGSPVAELVQKSLRFLPKKLQETVMLKAGTERLAALYAAIDAVRRGGTISVLGVYGGAADPMPMFTLFDKQVQLRMGQANVRRWTEDLMPFLTGDDDPLGVDSFATHHLPLDQAPDAYAKFQAKEDGYVKVVFQP